MPVFVMYTVFEFSLLGAVVLGAVVCGGFAVVLGFAVLCFVVLGFVVFCLFEAVVLCCFFVVASEAVPECELEPSE